jgi:hypothetical protein
LVDVKTKFCELNFDGDSFVKYCMGTPESLAQACLELLDDRQDLDRRRDRGIQFASRMPADENIGSEFIRLASIDINVQQAA